jgi:hydroxyacylglutathione hydrolase
VTGSQLPERFQEIGENRQVAVICGSGYRSSVAASFLQHHGYRNIVNVLGGMSAWKEAKFPVVKS